MTPYRGLIAVFGSTLFQLCGVFMLLPLLLLLLKRAEVSNTVAGLSAMLMVVAAGAVFAFARSARSLAQAQNTSFNLRPRLDKAPH